MGIKYGIWELLERGFTRLCKIPVLKVQRTHHIQMGLDVYAAFIYVKTRLDAYTHTVAAEPPIMVHADSCSDHKGCAKDWVAVWWNGMGQLLLDAKNPHPFDKALDRFKLLQFGRVGEDCKRHMFSDVLLVNIPLAHSHCFIIRVRDRLVQKFIHT